MLALSSLRDEETEAWIDLITYVYCLGNKWQRRNSILSLNQLRDNTPINLKYNTASSSYQRVKGSKVEAVLAHLTTVP